MEQCSTSGRHITFTYDQTFWKELHVSGHISGSGLVPFHTSDPDLNLKWDVWPTRRAISFKRKGLRMCETTDIVVHVSE